MDSLPVECVEEVMWHGGPQLTSCLATLSKTMSSASQSEQLWRSFLPAGYWSVISRQSSSHYLLSMSDDSRRLVTRLCQRPLLINQGTMSYMIDKRTAGKIKLMIGTQSMAMSTTPNNIWRKKRDNDCWFGKSAMSLACASSFEIRARIHARRLSPKTLYAAYLVFKLEEDHFGFANPYPPLTARVGLIGEGAGGEALLYDERGLDLLDEKSTPRWEHSGVGLGLEMGLYRHWTRKLEMKWKEALGGQWWREVKLGEFWNEQGAEEEEEEEEEEDDDNIEEEEEDDDNKDDDKDNKEKEVEIVVMGTELDMMFRGGLIVHGIEFRPN